MKIGLLEDNPAIIDYMKNMLYLAGHEVFSHTHGETLVQTLFAAYDAHSPLPYDLAIIDILLPGEISGSQTIAELRKRFSSKALPIIVVSACSREKLEQIQELFPEIPTLRKPFKIQTLFQLIQQVCGN